MRSRRSNWILLCLLLLAGAWLFWPSGNRRVVHKNGLPVAQKQAVVTTRSASTAPLLFGSKNVSTNGVVKLNPFAYRLSNTKKSIGELVNDPHAILLENALLDTRNPLNFSIAKNLQAQGDPGAYIVQANGPIDNAFRARLAAAGAQIVSYIPNDAYLVTASAGGAAGLAGQPEVQSVIPYEPYYKISSSLLGLAVEQKSLPDNTVLTLGLFANDTQATIDQITKLGATLVGTDQSPFGPIVRVVPSANWTVFASLSGVQIVEVAHQRALANDLARVTLGISADTVTATNYLNLYGSNVLVEMNDSGVDQTHPDFSFGGSAETPGTVPPSRVIGDSALSLVDTNGHGTHVAGIIAGNGSKSYTIKNTPQGSVTNADFRGKASAADLYSVAFLDANGNSLAVPDDYLQSAPAQTNALISNNSWNYTDDNAYDLAAASYDAAVRDALPLVTGSQPVLFVFAAGNDGGGTDDGDGGDSDTILSPGTAKNVITVGALEQTRNITNTYTPLGTTNQTVAWQAATDNGNQVASYSARGNVGIGTEGSFGRFKPDVVAPGSFVVSTRSGQWDQGAYYNPTNYYFEENDDQFINANSQNNYSLSLNFSPPTTTFDSNVVGVNIQIVPNADSPVPFPILQIYVSDVNYPNPANAGSYDFVSTNNQVSIPPDGGGSYLSQIQDGNLFYVIVNTNGERVSYDIQTEITATNQDGNYFTVLSNLNDTIGPWYRYESGTSMAAPAVSGTLALIQDYFTNTLHATPSPALLKAMLINGSRPVGDYTYSITNDLNFEGWGLINLPDSLPAGITNRIGASCSSLILDQGPTNALATGDSQTYLVIVNPDPDSFAQAFPLQVTLAWTDPPGNPAAAIKLVNNLDLVITNIDTGDVYFGNDIAPGSTFNEPWDTNTAPNLDSINNVENIFLQPLLAGSYSVTVVGRSVNVNAVTAQTNNVVQDYALVISCGEGEVTNAITVTASPLASNPISDQQITYVGVGTNGVSTNSTATGGVFLNQLAGANTPLLGTNTIGAGSNYTGNAVITLGMTNQWHFYVVRNTTTFTNAAFVTFTPDTLTIPRMGVFADSDANSTQPEADIDLYVASPNDPNAAGLTNLNPNVISNCVNGVYGDGASLSRGGTEFVAYDNSTAGQVYYVAVKSETADAAEYGFLPVFSQQPFSTMQNGIETVNGLVLPVNIPDGSPAHPGTAYIFALAIQPIEVQDVIVGDQITHQNFGDLIGTLNHGEKTVVLNNHDSLFNSLGIYNFTYDDGPAPVVGSQPPDGPGSLQTFQGQQGIGPWIFTEVDDALTHTGAVTGLTITITPHLDLRFPGINVAIPGGGYFYGYIDVPVGTTNLTLSATNISGTALDPNHDTLDPLDPGMLFEKLGEQPEPPPTPPTNYDKMVTLTNGTPPGGTISIGPSDIPRIQPGRYFVTLYNPSATPQEYFIIATLGIGQVQAVDFNGGGSVPLLDDAVTYAYITNYPTATSTNETIATIAVGIRVDHPRISDLVFHLISPDGTRYLLMENRGGTSTNGAGATTTSGSVMSDGFDNTPQTFNDSTYVDGWQVVSGNVDVLKNGYGGGQQSSDGSSGWIDLAGNTPGTIVTNFATVTGTAYTLSFAYSVNAEVSNLTSMRILINGNPLASIIASNDYTSPNILWHNTSFVFTATSPFTSLAFQDTKTSGDLAAGNYLDAVSVSAASTISYLVFTEDTNLTTTPIKFAPTPFIPTLGASTNGYVQWTTSSGGDGHWFKAVVNSTTSPLDWDQADQAAHGEGGYLATVTSDAKNNFVFSLINNPIYFMGDGNNGSGPAIGGIRTNSTSPANLDWTWETGEPWSYTDWQVNQPDSPVETRLEYYSYNQGVASNKWNNISPTDTNLGGYVIEKNTINTNITLLDYLPEESLDPLIGTSAYGVWTLEIQDDRVGATNNAVLDSWQLQFVFADTNPAPAVLTNSIPLTNTVPANGIVWYQVNVPLNADIATNTLIFASLPVNLLVNPNTPDTAGATTLLANSTGGSANLTATTAPPLIPGSTYYLGVQNNNPVAVNFAVEVTFHLLGIPYAYTEPAQLVTGTSAQLNGMASPNGYAATAWFQWGTNTLYGNQTPPVAVGASYGVVYTTNTIINLVTNVPYHFQLVVSNAQGVVYGFDQILDEANVVAWGPDYAGQLNVPTNLNNVVAIAGAYDHSLALRTNGLVVAWGDDTFGQVNVPSGLSNVVAVAGGQYYSLALQSSGTVVSWGANLLTQTNVPAGLSNVVTIAGGTYSSLALQNNGNVVAWGATFFGLTTVPASASNMVAVAGGGYHSLALKNDGTVIVWGDDSAGQTNVPANLNNVAAIAAGGYHSLALKYDGTVVAWGDDSVGQTNVPVGLSNVVAVAAGGFHSMALKADGTVVAWGDNTAGQTSVPVGLTNVVAISGGYLHSLALTPQLLVNSTNVIVLTLVPFVPQTNNIFGGGITYYKVTVPTNADFATNILLFANNGPLNIWFSTNTPPVLNSTDAIQLSTAGGVTNGVWIISSNTPAALVPGSTYYLGVQNPNSFTVNYAVEVDFHLITANVTLPINFYSIIHTNINGTNGYLLTWFAPSNDLFQVQWADNIPPVWNTFSNIISFNTNAFTGPLLTQFNFFDDGTQTGGFPDPTRFYNLILLGSLSNLTNGLPQTNSVAPGSTAYFAINVPTNTDIATNNLIFASSAVNLLFNQNTPPSGMNAGGFTLLASSTGGSTNLSTTGIPPLVPGATYYLGVKNTNTVPVNFSLQVNFHSAASPATNTVYPISNVTYTNGNFLLTWLAPTNDIFEVQVATNLASPIVWQTIAMNIVYTGPLTATNGWFSYLDTNSTGTLRFYQLLLQGVPASVPPITGFAYTTNGFTLTWSAPASDQFNVRWATNFVPPVNWTTFSNIITSTNGIFSFTDTNAPLLMKFYELILLP